jgi:hypothetical protein
VFQVDAIPISWGIDGAAPPGDLEELSATNKARYREFAADADDDLFFEWVVPYGIDTSKDITFSVEGWITNATGPAQGETIIFGLKGASIANSEALSSALGSAVTTTFTEPTPATHVQNDRWVSPFSTTVTITGLAAGELVIFNLYRDVDDTYEKAVGAGWLKIKYALEVQES